VSAPGRSRRLRGLAFAALAVSAVPALAVDLAQAASASAARAPGTPPPASATRQLTDFSNPRHVIANGSGSSSGGNFTISGTIGQAEADPLQPSTGGNFAISGGFWFTAATQIDDLFKNGFEGP
jgi:hypothetical protein